MQQRHAMNNGTPAPIRRIRTQRLEQSQFRGVARVRRAIIMAAVLFAQRQQNLERRVRSDFLQHEINVRAGQRLRQGFAHAAADTEHRLSRCRIDQTSPERALERGRRRRAGSRFQYQGRLAEIEPPSVFR